MVRERGIFIILGMHRSGTSMVAGLLHRSGIHMGNAFRKPLAQNPLGFFEEESFRQMNDDLLNSSGYVVKEWSTEFCGLTPSARALSGAIDLIDYFGRTYDRWGWKDPRSCLTICVWLRALQSADLLGETNILIVDRPVSAVSRSLVARGDIVDLSQGEVLYSMYHSNLERGILDYTGKIRLLRIRYEDLLEGDDVSRLEEFCEIDIDKKFIDVALDHSTKKGRR